MMMLEQKTTEFLDVLSKMPGLPKVPSAEKIDVDANGVISGLF